MNRARNAGRLAILALSALAIVPMTGGVAEAKARKGVPVKVMTRNVYLGADLTRAFNATGFHEFIEANGQILRDVDATNFPLRSQALGDEILRKRPDLVGLQEVALWRLGPVAVPPTISGQPFGAVNVKYDFLQLLLGQLEGKYKVAVVQEEFDFEAPADYNDVDNDAPAGSFAQEDPAVNDEGPNSTDDAEVNGRLTMRDVILVRKGGRAKVRNPQGGQFENLLEVSVAGLPVTVQRGWTAVDVKAQKGRGDKRQRTRFRFVNTHLEAFDDETQNPSIRSQQARELYAPDGPADKKRVVLLGDLNSDDDTVQPADQQAYRALVEGGFRERSTANPLSCCLNDPLLRAAGPGSLADFDHQVDHVMTNMKRKAKLLSSSVTGLAAVNGLWPSDHAGVFSKLRIR